MKSNVFFCLVLALVATFSSVALAAQEQTTTTTTPAIQTTEEAKALPPMEAFSLGMGPNLTLSGLTGQVSYSYRTDPNGVLRVGITVNESFTYNEYGSPPGINATVSANGCGVSLSLEYLSNPMLT